MDRQLNILNVVQPKCSSCSLRCGENRIVWGEGATNPDLFIIGEAPGDEEHYKGVPFIGPSGELLRTVLEEIQKQTERTFTWYITNTVMCRPPLNRNPTDGEVSSCFGRLIAEIEAAKPKKILLLGAVAAKAVLGLKSISQTRGSILKFRGIPIMPTWHPAYILRNPSSFQTFINDVCKILDHKIDNPWTKPRKWILVEEDEQVEDLLFNLNNKDVVDPDLPAEIDLETWKLNPMYGMPLWVGIRTNGTNYILSADKFKSIAHHINPNVNLCAHESRMEYPWLRYHFGFDAQNLEDTLVMAHLLDARTKGSAPSEKGLKSLAERKLDCPAWDKGMEPFLKDRMHLAPTSMVFPYLSYDIETGQALYPVLKEELIKDNQWDVYQNVLRPAIGFTNRMSYRGIRLDMEFLEKCEEQAEQIDKVRRKRLADITNNPLFNPGSPQQVSLYLYKDLGLRDVSGKASTDEKTITELLKIYGDVEFLTFLLEWRENAKMLSTYIRGLQKHCHPDGRIHSKYLLEGAETGRLSAKDFAIQTIPRPPSKEEIEEALSKGEVPRPNLRYAFLPDEGCDLLDLDYKQLELRVGAHMSQDQKLIEFINSGKDMHRLMAATVRGKTEDQVTKQERQFGKNMVFAVMFDAAVESMPYLFKKDFPFLDLPLAEKAVNVVRSSFPDLYLNALRLKVFAKENQYSITLFGRKRKYPFINDDNFDDVMKQATNMPIQGTASDINLLGSMRVEKEEPDVKPHMIIHDSLVASVPKKYNIDNVVKIMEDVPFETNVKFEAEVKLCDRWGVE